MATISGVITDSTATPCQRLVRLYRRSDGALAGTALSDPTTGAYSITALDASKHFRIVFDGPVDPYWNTSTMLACPCDSWVDLKGHTVTPSGTYSLSTGMFSTNCWYFPLAGAGGASIVESASDFTLGSGDFSLSLWCRALTSGAGNLLTRKKYPTSFAAFSIEKDASDHPAFKASFDGTTWGVTLTGTTAMADTTFYHIEVNRNGNNWYLMVNGTIEATATAAGSLTTSSTENSTSIYIASDSGGNDRIYGYYEDISLKKVALHTANFTAPAVPLIVGAYPGAPDENALILDYLSPG